MSINVGLLTIRSILTIIDRESFCNFLDDLKYTLLSNLNSHDINIFYRFYKKYLSYDDAIIFYKILNDNKLLVKNNMLSENINIYNRLIEVLYMAIEEMEHFIGQNRDCGVIKLGITQIPYHIIDKMQPLEFYDNLTDEDEPFWMRDVSDFIQK